MNDQIGKLTDGGHSSNTASDVMAEDEAEIPWEFRPVPLIWGLAFFAIAVVAMWLNPEGFSAEAIVLWPVTVAIVMLTSFTALITYLVRR
jgi:hypothetical protein